MKYRPAPRHIDVWGLRVVLSTRHRRMSWWSLVRLFDPAGAIDDYWAVVTVLDPAGAVVARRRFGSGDEAQHARDRFVSAVAAMTDLEHARATTADWAELLERIGVGAAPRRGDVVVLEDDGYVVPAIRGVAVAQVEVDVDLGMGGDERVRLHLGAHTLVLAGRAEVHAVDGTVTPADPHEPGALVGLRGAIAARLVLGPDGCLDLHLADGRRLVAPADWEVGIRNRVLVAARPGGVRLLPGKPFPDPGDNDTEAGDPIGAGSATSSDGASHDDADSLRRDGETTVDVDGPDGPDGDGARGRSDGVDTGDAEVSGDGTDAGDPGSSDDGTGQG